MRGLRIYYPCQSRSKNDYVYNRRLVFEKKYKEILKIKNFHSHHKGKKTKAYKSYEKVCARLDCWTEQTNREFEKYLENTLNEIVHKLWIFEFRGCFK